MGYLKGTIPYLPHLTLTWRAATSGPSYPVSGRVLLVAVMVGVEPAFDRPVWRLELTLSLLDSNPWVCYLCYLWTLLRVCIQFSIKEAI